ncbi:MAG: response regulator [Polyangiaceae bacterium]
MENRLVLILEDDEPTANALAAAIREADYEVVVSGGAAAGLDIAIEIKPDCVVCAIDLPDHDGTWVARAIRAHPSPVSVTPFVFLSPYDDAASRLEGFSVGADAYMTKPLRIEEVVAQVSALVQMAARLQKRRDAAVSLNPGPAYNTNAIEGDMRQMSIATVLSVLGMERRTGMFEVLSKKRHAQIDICAGYVTGGLIGGTRVSALAAMRVMLQWKVGRFSFTPLPPFDSPESHRTVQALLLDAAKAEDEAAASGAPQSDASSVATSFGGPPSRPDDTGPPSSRAMREAAPVSLAFDLIPSRRSDEIPAAEIAAAVEGPISVYEEPEAISIHFDDGDDNIGSEQALAIETARPTPRSPFAFTAATAALLTPTPPTGTVLVEDARAPIAELRGTPAIVPPPDSTASAAKHLPAPPPPPRALGVPPPMPRNVAPPPPRPVRVRPPQVQVQRPSPPQPSPDAVTTKPPPDRPRAHRASPPKKA